MCGIYGILQLDGRAAPADALRAMGRLTVHRGPDDEGVTSTARCAFGMRRLSIIDVGGGHQPLIERGRHAVARRATARSTTTASCGAKLTATGHRFRTGSDCETILHLYEEYGDALRRRI